MRFWIKKEHAFFVARSINCFFPSNFFSFFFFRLPPNLFIFSQVNKMQWNFLRFLTFFLWLPVQIILKFMFFRKVELLKSSHVFEMVFFFDQFSFFSPYYGFLNFFLAWLETWCWPQCIHHGLAEILQISTNYFDNRGKHFVRAVPQNKCA